MFEPLLLHPNLQKQLAGLLANPPHGILLVGPMGSGKRTLGRHLAASILGAEQENINSHPYVLVIDPESDSISIDEIRSLQQFLKLKVPGENNRIRRIISIQRAERMRREAQNALLKLLEEPPTDTVIIMTSSSSDSLLPTIVSRVNVVTVLPVGYDQAINFYHYKPDDAVQRAHALSQGQAGLMNALLSDDEHPLIRQVDLAKLLLSESPKDRLLRTDELAKDKPAVIMLLGALQRICHAALVTSSKGSKTAAVKSWHDRQAAVLKATESLKFNPNIKLLLDDLFLSI